MTASFGWARGHHGAEHGAGGQSAHDEHLLPGGSRDFRRELAAVKAKNLLVVIDSTGGSLVDGFTVYSSLRDFDGRVTTHARLALSAASLILMAGSRREISPFGQVLIHTPRASDISGTTDEVGSFAKSMTALTTSLAGVYLLATGRGTIESWLDTMRREATYTPAEALEAGLVHEIRDRRAEESIAAAAHRRVGQLVASQVLAAVHCWQIEKGLRQGIAAGIAQGVVAAWGAPPPKQSKPWSRAGGGDYPVHR